MRLWLIVLLSISTVGCGTVSPRTEREIALLRAEILDKGDAYADLKSRYRRALSDLAACRGESLGYIPELDDEYYSEGQVIGSGIIHTGMPDCCDECSQLYEGEFIDGETIIGGSSTYGRQPMSLDPQIRTPAPAVEPIAQPFEETQTLPTPNNRINDDSTMRSNLPMEHRFLASSTGTDDLAQRHVDSNRIPDAEPSFRPDSDWSPQAHSTSHDGGSSSPTDGTEWRKTSAFNANPISASPIDERFMDGGLEILSGSNATIEQVLINPERTYARDYDQDGGDDGIQLLIQPIDSEGQSVPRAAKIVVSVIDADETGEAQRIGLWKFEPYQVESFISSEPGHEGFVLDLPWQRRVPSNRDLVVFVRYVTPTGRKLETSLDIKVTPPLSEDIRMLDAVADRQKGAREQPRNVQNANAPQWRPVR